MSAVQYYLLEEAALNKLLTALKDHVTVSRVQGVTRECTEAFRYRVRLTAEQFMDLSLRDSMHMADLDADRETHVMTFTDQVTNARLRESTYITVDGRFGHTMAS